MELKTLTKKQIDRMNAIRWWHRIPVGLAADGSTIYTPGEVMHGPDGGDWPTTRFGMPADLTGKRVADIGAWDGFFSFEAENRGGEVTAFDVSEEEGGNWGGTEGFDFAQEVIGSNVRFKSYGAFDLENIRDFDVILFYGVLYHLKNPIQAIENLYEALNPGGILLIETAICPTKEPAVGPSYGVWDFQPGKNGDPRNYWYPSAMALVNCCAWAGFNSVGTVWISEHRITLRAEKPA